MKAVAIIPARLDSSRFADKLLADINGKSILQNVVDYASRLDFVEKVVIATDSRRVMDLGGDMGVETFWTEKARCGSERSFRYFEENPLIDYYVSIPADEPYIDPDEINRVWLDLHMDPGLQGRMDIVTLFTRFYCEDDLKSRLSCKIVTDSRGHMLYNSRSIIPATKSGNLLPLDQYKKHVGVFFFPNFFFRDHGAELWDEAPSRLADQEGLEQIRFIEKGFSVRVEEIHHIGFGIDSQEQLDTFVERHRREGIFK